MKKTSIFLLLVSALLVSGTMWAGMVPAQPKLQQSQKGERFERKSIDVKHRKMSPIEDAEATTFFAKFSKVEEQAPAKSPSRKAVLADGDVAKIGETSYATFGEALTAAEDGQTITLLKTVEGLFDISKSITIDLQSCYLQGPTNATSSQVLLTVSNNASVTVTGASESYIWQRGSAKSIVVSKGSTLTLDGSLTVYGGKTYVSGGTLNLNGNVSLSTSAPLYTDAANSVIVNNRSMGSSGTEYYYLEASTTITNNGNLNCALYPSESINPVINNAENSHLYLEDAQVEGTLTINGGVIEALIGDYNAISGLSNISSGYFSRSAYNAIKTNIASGYMGYFVYAGSLSSDIVINVAENGSKDVVAIVNNTDAYTELYNALYFAHDNDSVVLQKSTTLLSNTDIYAKITLDLGNYSISMANMYASNGYYYVYEDDAYYFGFLCREGASLKIKASQGKILFPEYCYDYNAKGFYEYYGFYIYPGASLTIEEGVSIEGGYVSIYNCGELNNKGSIKLARAYGSTTVICNAGTMTNSGIIDASSGQNSTYALKALLASTVTITGGEITGGNYGCIVFDGSGSNLIANISDGELIGCGEIYDAKITISGGSFECDDWWYTYKINNSDITITGGTYVNNYPGTSYDYSTIIYAPTSDPSTIKIEGGDFTSSYYLIYSAGATYTITGGRYSKSQYNNFYPYNSCKVNIKGGFYQTNNINTIGTQLYEGYGFRKENAGWYEVSASVAQIGGYGYPSLAQAIDDAEDNGIVEFITNSDEADIVCDKNISLKLGDYTLSANLETSGGALVEVFAMDEGGIESVSTGSNVKLYGGTYPFDPQEFLPAGYGKKDNGNGTWTVGHDVCQIGSTGYWTLSAAFDAVVENTPTIITMLDNCQVDEELEVGANDNITLDLNGYQVSYSTRKTSTSALITNYGTLTIKDSQDIAKNGTGGGVLSCATYGYDMKLSPGYANNNIRNFGHVIVESGKITTNGLGLAAYAIDNDAANASTGSCDIDIHGGFVESEGSSVAIRMYLSTTNDSKVNIDGGKITSLWVQEYQEGAKGFLSVKNAEFTNNIDACWNSYCVSKNLTVKLANVHIENNRFFSGIDYSNRQSGDSTFSCDSVRIRTYSLTHPFKHLHNGQFQFKLDTIYYGYVLWDAAAQAKYTEADGWIVKDFKRDGTTLSQYRSIYMTKQRHYREFVQNIEDGYGLVLMSGEDGENLWYEILPAKGKTTSDGDLTSPWHDGPTWVFNASDEVIPTSTDAAMIDHNVYVEAGTKDAVANNLIVESGNTLTIQSGAMLQVGDGGIVLKDETSKIIIEPEAVLTVGANGIISDDIDNIIVQGNKDGFGVLLIDPEVTINTQPKGTVEMVANVGKFGTNNYAWHRFALPVVQLEQAWTKVPNAPTYLYEWSYIDKDWTLTSGGSTGMVPFLGYTITTNTDVQDVKYTFYGDLLGNTSSNIDFTNIGYGYFGNSYTGHMLAKVLLQDVMQLNGVEGTVWMWNPNAQTYTAVSLADYDGDAAEDLEDYEKEVSPMQTFILKLNSGDGANIDINYNTAIWSNPRYGLVEESSSASARKSESNTKAYMKISVETINGVKDHVRMTEGNAFSDEHENGVDATKYINTNSINLYATVAGENYTSLYTNSLAGKTLTLQTMDEAGYTLSIGHVEGSEYALVDVLTGEVINLVEGNTYSFAAQPNSTSERFRIVPVSNVVTGMGQTQLDSNSKGIYTILGQYLGETSMWNMMPKGVYVVDGVKLVK